MKNLSIVLLLTVFIACKESFKSINPKKFNSEIRNRTDIRTPEHLIKLFYAYPKNEGVPQLIITSMERSKNLFAIQLIHERVPDDAVYAEKITMVAQKTGLRWNVSEIRRNWKCQEHRGGSTSWGIVPCP